MTDKETDSTMTKMVVGLIILAGGIGMAFYSWSWWSLAWLIGAVVLNAIVLPLIGKK